MTLNLVVHIWRWLHFVRNIVRLFVVVCRSPRDRSWWTSIGREQPEWGSPRNLLSIFPSTWAVLVWVSVRNKKGFSRLEATMTRKYLLLGLLGILLTAGKWLDWGLWRARGGRRRRGDWRETGTKIGRAGMRGCFWPARDAGVSCVCTSPKFSGRP